MKKLFPGILALLMAFSCLVGCGETPDSSTPAGSNPPASTPGGSTPDETDPMHALNAAKEFINGDLIKKNLETRKDYTVRNQYYSWFADENFEITWTVTDAEGNATTNVTIEEGAGDYDTVKVNPNLEEDFTYILKGTITHSNGQSVEVSFTRKVLKAGEYLPVMITEKPLEDVVYYLYVYQSTLAKDMFFNGNDAAASFYFGTTEDYMEAVEVGVEYIENSDAFNVFFTTTSGAKKYIGVKLSDDGEHDNIKATDAPVSSFVWSDEYKTIITHLDVNKEGKASDYYLGNYGTKDTISCSMVSYAGGEGNNVGGLVRMVHKDELPITDADKVATEKNKLTMKSAILGAGSINLPATGTTYNDVSITWSEDSDVASIENGVLTTTAVTEATTVTLTATIVSNNESDTKTFTIALNPNVETLNNPVEGTAYNMVIKQYTRGEAIYLDGTFGARYLNTTTNAANAAKILVEAADNGYKFYILIDEVKNYLTIYSNTDGKDAVKFSAESGNVFSYNADKNAWCTMFGENEYYVGTYSDFNTASASKSSYIDAEKTGVSQFPLEFVVAAAGGTDTPNPTPDYTPMSITEALAAADGTNVEVSGTVDVINYAWTDANKNMSVTIKDANGNTLYIFKLASQVALGDIITVKGAVGSHNGAKQIAAGATAVITDHDDSYDEPAGGDTPTPSTPEEIVNAAYALAEGASLEGTQTLTGVITSIDTAYSAQHSNVSVVIVIDNMTDKPILCYRMKGTGADTIGVADVITVTGTLKNYYGKIEFDAGCTFVLVSTHVCETWEDATCQVPETCPVCGDAKVGSTTVNHAYENGACKWCNDPEGVETVTASVNFASLGWADKSKHTSHDLDENVTVSCAGGSNTGNYYNTGTSWRIYASDTPAGTVTISVDEGYELVSIKITAATGTYAFLYVDGTTTDICNQTVAVSGSSVLLNSVKNGSDGKHVRITDIEVVYKAATPAA